MNFGNLFYRTFLDFIDLSFCLDILLASTVNRIVKLEACATFSHVHTWKATRKKTDLISLKGKNEAGAVS